MILVKSQFTPNEAGLYSSIAALGKITLWLAGPVEVLLLPKATEQHGRGESCFRLVRRSLLSVILLCGTVTGVFFCFPSMIVGSLFGEEYTVGASLLGLYGLSMTFSALSKVWLSYYPAVRAEYYTYVLLTGVTLLLVSLITVGSALTNVVISLVGVGVLMYRAGELLLLLRSRCCG